MYHTYDTIHMLNMYHTFLGRWGTLGGGAFIAAEFAPCGTDKFSLGKSICRANGTRDYALQPLPGECVILEVDVE